MHNGDSQSFSNPVAIARDHLDTFGGPPSPSGNQAQLKQPQYNVFWSRSLLGGPSITFHRKDVWPGNTKQLVLAQLSNI